MRVTIEVDDELFERVAQILGGSSKREVVHRALEAVARHERVVHLARIRGDDLDLQEVSRRRFDGTELLAAEGWRAYEAAPVRADDTREPVRADDTREPVRADDTREPDRADDTRE